MYLSTDQNEGAYTQDKDHTGCYSRYRFHEKRQDFSVLSSPYPHRQVDTYAVVKIGYSQKDSMIRVSLDEKNTGNFHTCFVEHAEFAPEWWRSAHLGISSSTGQLADNHDILSVETVEGEGDPDKVSVSPSRAAAKLEEEENSAFQAMMAKRSVNPAALTAEETSLVKVMEAMDQHQRLDVSKLKRELEHRIVAVEESLNNMIKKLQQSSDLSESRIFDIEQSLKRDVQSSMNTKLEKRVRAVEDVFADHLKEEVKKSSRKWMIPFVVLVSVVGVVLLFVYVGEERACDA